MAFAKENFIKDYVQEVKERIDSINFHSISLKKNPKEKKTHLTQILINLRTIKTSSKMLGFEDIEQISNSLENVYKAIQESKIELSNNIFKLSFRITEFLEDLLEEIKVNKKLNANPQPIIEICNKAASGFLFNLEKITLKESNADEIDEADNIYQLDPTQDSFNKINSINIDIERINSILKNYDSLIIKHFKLKQQIKLFEDKLKNKKSQKNYELPRQLQEELTSVENCIFDTQNQLTSLKMLPLDMVLFPLKDIIKKEAAKLSKRIIIDIPPTSLILDKEILENVKEILFQLTRNSIFHGIENKKTRTQLGKNEAGMISVHITQIANKFIIKVHDDGCGIQYEKIREKAILDNHARKEEIYEMSDKELQQYLFLKGFTTSSHVTKNYGRGYGLDIVKKLMEKIKGKISITTEKNKGSTFELTIPLTLINQQGIFAISGSYKVMIPSHYITEICPIITESILTLQNQTFVNIKGIIIPLYSLSSIIETKEQNNTGSIIIVEYLETKMALLVDSIIKSKNIINKPLPKCLNKIKSIQGIVYDENYSIIPIIDIPNIMQRMKELVLYDTKKAIARNINKTKRILIVDDSSTTREIELSIFKNNGYIVESAIDGLDAIEKLKKQDFDLIVTDINMPRMDGRTFIKNIREKKDLERIPIIILTGGYDIYSKKSFLDIGAQSFILKSEFQRENLLETAEELLDEN